MESRNLRKIFGAVKKEVIEEWRRMRSEELHELKLLQSIL
jgi:hypothetical protein